MTLQRLQWHLSVGFDRPEVALTEALPAPVEVTSPDLSDSHHSDVAPETRHCALGMFSKTSPPK